MPEWFDRIDRKISGWMDKYCHPLMRISISVIFIWFGLLKPLGMSPEEELIRNTVYWLPVNYVLPFLGIWEVAIGAMLLLGRFTRFALLLLFLQLPGTMLPLFLLPDVCFTRIPFGLTLEGQYIVKNIFLISAAFVIGSKVRHQDFDHKLP